MTQPNILRIIDLCMEIDICAGQIFSELSKVYSKSGLGQFWMDRAKEEERHTLFWKALKKHAIQGVFPQVFKDPNKMIAGLESNLQRIRLFLHRDDKEFSVTRAFFVAYRVEFYMLHPAFEMLFQYADNLAALNIIESPEEEYESHIEQFLIGLRKWGEVTPELDIFGELLQDLWKRNRELIQESNRDPLTGLFNRRGFLNVVHPLAHLSRRNNQLAAAMMVDVDRFKAINDARGHDAGDAVLRQLSRRLQDALRGSDVVGRWGGEEFMIFLFPIESSGINQTAEKIRQAIAQEQIDGHKVTISIGVATGVVRDEPPAGLEQLFRVADDNLYKAKASGRNRVVSSIL